MNLKVGHIGGKTMNMTMETTHKNGWTCHRYKILTQVWTNEVDECNNGKHKHNHGCATTRKNSHVAMKL